MGLGSSSVERSEQSATHPAGDGRTLKVPGCGLPINYEVELKDRFRDGIEDISFERLTVREVSMLGLIEALTDKPGWSAKAFDQDITEKWRREALEMPWVSEKTWEWCLRELQDKARDYTNSKMIAVLDTASRCIKADNLVLNDLRESLVSATKLLLAQSPRDWHPGSDERVLNLVHPSLYPAVYGKTRVLKHKQIPLDGSLAPHDGSTLLEVPDGGQYPSFWSHKFQWLPCDVSFVDDDDNAAQSIKINSYINNLHPEKYRSLYSIIESLISLAIPAWDQVLVNSHSGRTPLRIWAMGAETDPPHLPDGLYGNPDEMDEKELAACEARMAAFLALPDNPDNAPFEDGLEPDEESNKLEIKFRSIRRVIHPEPGVAPSSSYEDWKSGRIHTAAPIPWRYGHRIGPREFKFPDINLRKAFAQTGLQVIVKLASIELSPDKPTYEGGNWHLEGMCNERIVATSIYYYDVFNISESRIRFRQKAELDCAELDYPQDDHAPLCQLFGTADLTDEPAIQEIGSIATPQGRLLSFPNTFQHKVEPFHLVDPTQPGHRRFIVLWLVDPNCRVLSTANVPPQQLEWWTEKASETLKEVFSPELRSMVDDQLEADCMTLDEAKAYRLELMAERTTFTKEVQSSIEKYNFCEH